MSIHTDLSARKIATIVNASDQDASWNDVVDALGARCACDMTPYINAAGDHAEFANGEAIAFDATLGKWVAA